MALGAATINDQAGKSASAPTYIDDISIVGDAAYPTGGTAGFQAFIRGLTGIKESRTIDAVLTISSSAQYAVYDKTNDKLMMFVRATGAEVGNNTNLSGTTFRFIVLSH